MLRRIFKNPDGGSISSMLLPGCASLVVPILAVTALEIPAAAIDKIAAPVLGRSHDVARLFRTPVAEGGDGGRPYALAFGDTLIVLGRSARRERVAGHRRAVAGLAFGCGSDQRKGRSVGRRLG